MLIITKKIKEFLQENNLSQNELSKLLDIDHGNFGKMVTGKNVFPNYVIEKILPILKVSQEEFESWILADKYSREIVESALKAKKKPCHSERSEESQRSFANSQDDSKLILTTQIDSILQKKGMSRTALSKQIKYSQSGLNAILTGKRSMSKSVFERLSNDLKIPQDEIISWILADKYSLKVLELSLAEFK